MKNTFKTIVRILLVLCCSQAQAMDKAKKIVSIQPTPQNIAPAAQVILGPMLVAVLQAVNNVADVD